MSPTIPVTAADRGDAHAYWQAAVCRFAADPRLQPIPASLRRHVGRGLALVATSQTLGLTWLTCVGLLDSDATVPLIAAFDGYVEAVADALPAAFAPPAPSPPTGPLGCPAPSILGALIRLVMPAALRPGPDDLFDGPWLPSLLTWFGRHEPALAVVPDEMRGHVEGVVALMMVSRGLLCRWLEHVGLLGKPTPRLVSAWGDSDRLLAAIGATARRRRARFVAELVAYAHGLADAHHLPGIGDETARVLDGLIAGNPIG